MLSRIGWSTNFRYTSTAVLPCVSEPGISGRLICTHNFFLNLSLAVRNNLISIKRIVFILFMEIKTCSSFSSFLVILLKFQYRILILNYFEEQKG